MIAASGAATPAAYQRQDNEWLPSFVSKLDLTDDLLLRPFGVRVAYNCRSAYLVSLSGAATGIHNDTYADLPATLHYDISHDVAFDFEANNLLDEKQRTYDGSEEGLRTDVFFGRIFKASITAKF